MALARSKLTSQSRITVPAVIRQKLGLGPGSALEWYEDGGKIVVRRAGQYTFEDIHKALFADKPVKKVTIEDMDEGIREYMRKRHPRPRSRDETR
jgi:AbrB family looped-hinge helix DNA binding protein